MNKRGGVIVNVLALQPGQKRAMISDDFDADCLKESAMNLEEDSLIQERVEMKVIKRNTTIGIISPDFGTLSWQDSTLCDVRCVSNKMKPPARRPSDPSWFDSCGSIPISVGPTVEILIVEGIFSFVPSALIKRKGITVVICITEVKRLRSNKRLRLSQKKEMNYEDVMLPSSWHARPIQRFTHSSVGGVSDGLFQVTIFHRLGVEAS